LLTNIAKRGREYEADISADYLNEIQNSYFEFIKQQQEMRIVIIDCNKVDFVENQLDYERIKEIIFQDWEIGVHRITP
jgi:deoxyadenosine/deoxycytidine kinase